MTRYRWATSDLGALIAVSLVPAFLMSRLLRCSSSCQLVGFTPSDGVGYVTDTAGMSRLSYLLRESDIGLVSTAIGYPNGQSLITVATISQATQIAINWLLALLFSGFIATNIVIFAGWTGTSFTVTKIVKRFSGSQLAGTATGIAVSILPSFQYAAGSFPSYVHLWLPILTLKGFQKSVTTGTSRRGWTCVALMYCGMAFTDWYLLVITTGCILLVAGWRLASMFVRILARRINGQEADQPAGVKYRVLIFWFIGSLTSLLISNLALHYLQSPGSDLQRSFNQIPDWQLQISSRPLSELLRPSSYAVGPVLYLVGVAVLIRRVRAALRQKTGAKAIPADIHGWNGEQLNFSDISICLLLMGLRIPVPGGENATSLAEVMTFLVPGIRFLDRFWIFAAPFVLMSAVYELRRIDLGGKRALPQRLPVKRSLVANAGCTQDQRSSNEESMKRHQKATEVDTRPPRSTTIEGLQTGISTITTGVVASLLVLLSVVLVTDYQRLEVADHNQSWSMVRTELAKYDSAVLIAYPISREGRDWIEQGIFEAKLVNDFSDERMNPLIEYFFGRSATEILQFSNSVGATHLLAVNDERGLGGKLDGVAGFEKVTDLTLTGFGGEDFPVRLYRLTGTAAAPDCNPCTETQKFAFERIDGLVYPADIVDGVPIGTWVGSTESVLAPVQLPRYLNSELSGDLLRVSDMSGNLTITKAPCLEKVTGSIMISGGETLFRLTGANPTMDIDIGNSIPSQITLKVMEPNGPCQIAEDARQLLIYLSPVTVNSTITFTAPLPN